MPFRVLRAGLRLGFRWRKGSGALANRVAAASHEGFSTMSPTLCEPLSHWETTNRTGNPSLSGVVFEGQFVLLLFCLRVRIVYRVTPQTDAKSSYNAEKNDKRP
jgi:hypothetical protein